VKKHLQLAEAQIRALKKLPIKIHILGPGFSGNEPDLLKKRLELREVLQNEFPLSEVFFSEDDDFHECTDVFDNLLDEIAFHAQVADFVIAVVGGSSRGVLIELGRLSMMCGIADKLQIFTAKEAFVNDPMYISVIRHLPNDFFTRRDVLECNLVTRARRTIMSYLLRRESGLLSNGLASGLGPASY